MSAIRIPGPDGHTILVVIDDGATPHRGSRGIRGGIGNPVVHVPPRRNFVDLTVRRNPDNGGVEAPITEVST